MNRHLDTNMLIKIHYLPNEALLAYTAGHIKEGRSVTLTIRGNSMNPFLADGRDLVILSPFTEKELLPGAVVLARESNGRLLLHRIIHRQGQILTILGDGNTEYTEQTQVSEVIGLLTSIIRKGKKYSCDERFWKYYSICWMKLYPARKVLLYLFRLTHR